MDRRNKRVLDDVLSLGHDAGDELLARRNVVDLADDLAGSPTIATGTSIQTFFLSFYHTP